MRIDAHQHFWDITRTDYGWLTPDLKALYKNYQPIDLKRHLSDHNIGGTILVQAAPTIAETEYLLLLAEQNDFIQGVVGWLDFEEPDQCQSYVSRLLPSKLVGLRPMIQDIENLDWLLRPSVYKTLKLMENYNLVFDALIKPEHLTRLKIVSEKHQNLTIVINHGAKPNIKHGEFERWKSGISAFKSNSHVYCKLSGLVTEADSPWNREALDPYLDVIFDVFGDNRVIWGSDWPVSLLNSTYGAWLDYVEDYMRKRGVNSTAVMGDTAQTVYRLGLCSE